MNAAGFCDSIYYQTVSNQARVLNHFDRRLTSTNADDRSRNASLWGDKNTTPNGVGDPNRKNSPAAARICVHLRLSAVSIGEPKLSSQLRVFSSTGARP
jgi:hypothetical protein